MCMCTFSANLLFFSFIAGQAFPKFGLLVAIAGIFLNLHLIGTFWGVVLIQLVGTLLLMIWIPVAAFQSVDRRMEEAARDVGSAAVPCVPVDHVAQAGPTIAAAVLLSFVNTFYETEGAWLIGQPAVKTMPVLMISFINNQPVIQFGAVLSVILWIPSSSRSCSRGASSARAPSPVASEADDAPTGPPGAPPHPQARAARRGRGPDIADARPLRPVLPVAARFALALDGRRSPFLLSGRFPPPKLGAGGKGGWVGARKGAQGPRALGAGRTTPQAQRRSARSPHGHPTHLGRCAPLRAFPNGRFPPPRAWAVGAQRTAKPHPGGGQSLPPR